MSDTQDRNEMPEVPDTLQRSTSVQEEARSPGVFVALLAATLFMATIFLASPMRTSAPSGEPSQQLPPS